MANDSTSGNIIRLLRTSFLYRDDYSKILSNGNAGTLQGECKKVTKKVVELIVTFLSYYMIN